VAIREALKAKEEGTPKTILFNLSGHGLVDMSAYDQYLAGDPYRPRGERRGDPKISRGRIKT